MLCEHLPHRGGPKATFNILTIGMSPAVAPYQGLVSDKEID